ncbi:DUF302 domain-containing protein [Cribrihabitans sp. XS_ASV171]
MKMKALAAALALIAAPALADDDLMRVEAQGDVPAVMDALVAAVEGAGATVFARVDHAAGAQGAGMELAPAQVLIFGNPQVGTPAMQANPEAGLFLPMKVLVYERDGKTWLVYQDPEEMLDDLDGIDDDADYIAKMAGALQKLTAKAVGG